MKPTTVIGIYLITILIFLTLSGPSFPRNFSEGEIFEIKKFKSLGGQSQAGEKEVLSLSFRIKKPGTWSGLTCTITLYDRKKLSIPDALEDFFLDPNVRQTISVRSKEYVRERGTGKSYRLDDFKGLRTYSYICILKKRYAFALAEVGNKDEKVYAIIPDYADVREFIPPR